jgi:hypothetical protein
MGSILPEMNKLAAEKLGSRQTEWARHFKSKRGKCWHSNRKGNGLSRNDNGLSSSKERHGQQQRWQLFAKKRITWTVSWSAGLKHGSTCSWQRLESRRERALA